MLKSTLTYYSPPVFFLLKITHRVPWFAPEIVQDFAEMLDGLLRQSLLTQLTRSKLCIENYVKSSLCFWLILDPFGRLHFFPWKILEMVRFTSRTVHTSPIGSFYRPHTESKWKETTCHLNLRRVKLKVKSNQYVCTVRHKKVHWVHI